MDAMLIEICRSSLALAIRSGWRDRRSLQLDLAYLQGLALVSWIYLIVAQATHPVHLAELVLPSLGAWVSWKDGMRVRRLIGSESDMDGWRTACATAARDRELEGPRRGYLRLVLLGIAVVATIRTMIWSAGVGVDHPGGVWITCIYFALMLAILYLDAVEPPPPGASMEHETIVPEAAPAR